MGLSWLGQGVYDAAVTGVGSLFLAKGFTALGEQTGIALGFMGVGLTYGSPVGPIYGFAGYALFVTVNAEYIETFPPNFPAVEYVLRHLAPKTIRAFHYILLMEYLTWQASNIYHFYRHA